jgi:hypothetical protein
MDVTPAHAKAISRAAYIFTFPLVVYYGEMYSQVIDTSSPTYSGGFGRWLHLRTATSQGSGSVSTPIDTLYSSAWLDLRAEPWVFEMPRAVSTRFQASRWVDLWGFDLDDIGFPDGGSDGAPVLFASPTWVGEVPAGIDHVVRGDSAFVRTLTCTQLCDPEDRVRIRNIQEQLSLASLSTHLGQPAPKPAPVVRWWRWREGIETTDEFWSCANFVMSLTATNRQDRSILDRLAEIGVKAGEPWDPVSLGSEMADAISAGLDDALTDLMRAAAGPIDASLLHRSREETDKDYFARALGALVELRPRHLVGRRVGDPTLTSED